jgi:NAD-dependent SIR2 family protein deacetylase
MTRVYYTVECVKNCHFRVDADYPDARGRIEKVWDPRCPYCGSAIFKRWWRHEREPPKEKK